MYPPIKSLVTNPASRWPLCPLVTGHWFTYHYCMVELYSIATQAPSSGMNATPPTLSPPIIIVRVWRGVNLLRAAPCGMRTHVCALCVCVVYIVRLAPPETTPKFNSCIQKCPLEPVLLAFLCTTGHSATAADVVSSKAG